MKNIRDYNTMACWQPTSDSTGSYSEVCNSLEAVRRLLCKPVAKLRRHLEQQNMHVPEVLVFDTAATQPLGNLASTVGALSAAAKEALTVVVAYIEGSTRSARGASLQARRVRSLVGSVHGNPAVMGDWGGLVEHLLD
jgi:hypothetical protein